MEVVQAGGADPAPPGFRLLDQLPKDLTKRVLHDLPVSEMVSVASTSKALKPLALTAMKQARAAHVAQAVATKIENRCNLSLQELCAERKLRVPRRADDGLGLHDYLARSGQIAAAEQAALAQVAATPGATEYTDLAEIQLMAGHVAEAMASLQAAKAAFAAKAAEAGYTEVDRDTRRLLLLARANLRVGNLPAARQHLELLQQACNENLSFTGLPDADWLLADLTRVHLLQAEGDALAARQLLASVTSDSWFARRGYHDSMASAFAETCAIIGDGQGFLGWMERSARSREDEGTVTVALSSATWQSTLPEVHFMRRTAQQIVDAHTPSKLLDGIEMG